MLIKCQNCKHENQLGAIFCRGCGVKLDLDAVNPELIDARKPKVFKTLLKIFELLIFLGILALLAAVFVPWGFPPVGTLSGTETEPAKDNYEKLTYELDGVGRKKVYHFTPAEAAWLVSNTILTTNPALGIDVSFFPGAPESSDITVVVSRKLFGVVPTRLEMAVNAVPAGDAAAGAENPQPLSFNVNSVKYGRAPVPLFAAGFLTGKYASMMEGDQVRKLLAGIKSVTVDQDGKIVLTLKK
jgi:hypothetical protein